MTYQQWNHNYHYQAVPQQPLMHPWQRELGCPTPRPRSYSLGSRPPSSADLMEVSSNKGLYNPAPTTVLPLDLNRNYVYPDISSSKLPLSSHKKSSSKKWIWILASLVLAASSLSAIALWKFRSTGSRDPREVPASLHQHKPPVGHPPLQPDQPPQQQQHQQYNPAQPYHPVPHSGPPQAVHQAGQPQPQQQFHQPQQQPYYAQPQPQQQWQQQQQPYQQPQHYYQHPQQSPYPHHSDVHQQYQQPQYSYPQQYAAYQPPPQQYAQPVPHQQPQQPPAPYHHPEAVQYSEAPAAKPWILEHMETVTVPAAAQPVHHQHQQQQQQQSYAYHQQTHEHNQQQQQQAPNQPVEPELSRQEERAKARNEARAWGKQSKNKSRSEKNNDDDDSIWEHKEQANKTDNASVDGSELINVATTVLRVEQPVLSSYTESVTDSNGTVYVTSYEDAEDLTVEVVEEA